MVLRTGIWRWGSVLGAALVVLALPVPEGISVDGWRMFAIFAATIVGAITQPLPGGAMVLIGLCTTIFTGVLSLDDALTAYANPIVWLVLAAIFMSRAMVQTGLGRRLALHFIKAIGRRSLGLGYALIGTDLVLGSVVPSNGARSGGIIFPIATSLARAYQSEPGPSAGRIGAFLTVLLYQADVIICAMFLTGQASNLLMAEFARQVTGASIGYVQWMVAGAVPGLLSLIAVPLLLYRVAPPTVKETPEAATFAAEQLRAMGPMTRHEVILLLTFLLVAGLWIVSGWLGLNYTVVALLGMVILFLTGVLRWEDALGERVAWDVFIWYGGLVKLAGALTDFGLTKRFAETAAGYTAGWPWALAFALLLVVYFFAHYGFASITAHATAMFIPFTTLVIAAGAPPMLTVIAFACFSNLCAALTHYGTTPAPIWFGAGYVSQGTWWRLGLMSGLTTAAIWGTVGVGWWVLLGY